MLVRGRHERPQNSNDFIVLHMAYVIIQIVTGYVLFETLDVSSPSMESQKTEDVL